MTNEQMSDTTEYLKAWGCLAHPGVVQLIALGNAAIAQPEQTEGDAKDANSEDVLWQLLNAVTDEMNRRAIPGTWLSLAYKTGSEFITNHRAAIASQKGLI